MIFQHVMHRQTPIARGTVADAHRHHYDAAMSSKPPPANAIAVSPGRWFGAIGLLLVGGLLASSCLNTWATSRRLATNFVSPATWGAIVGVIPSPSVPVDRQTPRPAEWPAEAKVKFAPVALIVGLVVLATWIVGSIWLNQRTRCSLASAMTNWGIYGGVWWCLIGVWEWIWVASVAVGWESLAELFTVTPQFWLACCVSGWVTTLAFLGANSPEQRLHLGAKAAASPAGISCSRLLPGGSAVRWMWIACGIYIVVFTTMNWRLYFNLLIPHGDSAMYEEHLWNVVHGKGFRSYLDQGLFFGEHIQFVHLFLIPLYLIWPSHLMLELGESTALALGAWPVFWMTRRQTASDKTALAAAVAYLLYTPMQFLDIEIDLKTFRPEAFGIPLLLLTLDQLERRNLRGLLIGLAFMLTVKEDYALIFGPLGLWIVWHESCGRRRLFGAASPATVKETAKPDGQECPSSGRWVVVGILLSCGSVFYLWLATRVVMPWFRSGAEIHYAGYFRKFGETPEQIVASMLTNPGLLIGELCSTQTVLYALAMLAPVAFLPLCSAGRLAVGAPLFGILCLNELAKDPRHQFHAPLVAIVFWAVTGGIPRAETWMKAMAARFRRRGPSVEQAIPVLPRTLLWTSALTTGLFFGLSPLGISFWDPGSNWNWRTLYGTSRRAELFARVMPLIPRTSRVASTDFVHPRFTHHDRSYDYSEYRRKVSGYEQRVPDDTDFIVIDTQHLYSDIKRPEEIPEYRDHPEQWELLPDQTDGFFIVLKRRRP